MQTSDLIALFAPLDFIAVGFLMAAWFGSTLLIENPPKSWPSMSVLMMQYRREWMVQLITRQPRIFDAQIVSNLRQGISFFASACMIAIGGGLALIGNADLLRGVANDLTQTTAPVVVWELKLIVMLGIVANAFMKFVWSHRLFGYCAVLMAAVPNNVDDPLTIDRARKAAAINIAAARGFNRGLRSVYFGIASAAWLVGPVTLILAVSATLLMIGRREFASTSRSVLLEGTNHGPTPL